MEIQVFKKMATTLSPKIAVRVRGRHGIGKSQVVHQIADTLGLSVVERRLSQLVEGDIVGLPLITGEGKEKSTQFKPCDWLIDCCNNPRVLFLDELNRALPGVEQATFQLADSRKFYGYELHPQTRIFIAENIGDQYQVQTSDPAAISRYAVVDLDPSVEEWLEFASEHCSSVVVDFIRSNPGFLEHTKGSFENNKKYPDRRAWHRLDEELQKSELIDDPENPVFYAMCLSMVGSEAAIAFTKFSKEREQQISAKDIIKGWKKAKKKMGKETQEKYVEAVGKLEDLMKTHLLTAKEAEEYKNFMYDCPAEPRMKAWGALSPQFQNVTMVHKLVQNLLLETTSGGAYKTLDDVEDADPEPEEVDDSEETEEEEVEKAVEEVKETKASSKKK